jgi:hypothetical protein
MGIIKYADDIVIYALCTRNDGKEHEYRDVIQRCLSTFKDLQLILNLTKTKEMVISSKTVKPLVDPVIIEMVINMSPCMSLSNSDLII